MGGLPQRVRLSRERGLKIQEHDPESGNRFSEEIMLKQRDKTMIRFNLIGIMV